MLYDEEKITEEKNRLRKLIFIHTHRVYILQKLQVH